MKKIVAALCCVFVLSLALVGCGGNSGSSSADVKAAWIGTWNLYEMEDSGKVTSASDIEQLRALGLDVNLVLNEDGKGSLVLFGESTDGTWEAKSATEGTLTMQNQNVNMKIADSKLTIEQEGTKMTFTKGSSSSAAASSAAATTSATSASASAASASASASSASSSGSN